MVQYKASGKCLKIVTRLFLNYMLINNLSDVSSYESSDDEGADSLSTPSSSKQVESTRVSSSESESDSDNEICDEVTNRGRHKKDFKPKQEQHLGHSGLNVNIHEPTEIGNIVRDVIKYFTDQSNLYHRQNIGRPNWKESNKTLKWIDISQTGMNKYVRPNFLHHLHRKTVSSTSRNYPFKDLNLRELGVFFKARVRSAMC
ncbi:hypothetical protein C0J52_06618 [Blattella germanica]|nr:hypothetical protein C0J52_06618 [Blattella germanica]